MPYSKNNDLPDSVKTHLPAHAQDIYRETFNNAYKEYKDPGKRRNKNDPLDQVCHRAAWAAVKKKYKKGKDGNWHTKS
jgi:cation transport regulator